MNKCASLPGMPFTSCPICRKPQAESGWERFLPSPRPSTGILTAFPLKVATSGDLTALCLLSSCQQVRPRAEVASEGLALVLPRPHGSGTGTEAWNGGRICSTLSPWRPPGSGRTGKNACNARPEHQSSSWAERQRLELSCLRVCDPSGLFQGKKFQLG